MGLKKLNNYKRDDYTYEGTDGDTYDIKIIQTDERKYIEITLVPEDDEDEASEALVWDVEMLLDIADAARQAVCGVLAAPVTSGDSIAETNLNAPNVVDHRSDMTPSESIQASVDAAMKKSTDNITATESFSGDIERRKMQKITAPEKAIKRR